MNDSQRMRNEAVAIVSRLRQEGWEAYWAGGCVRDMLLGTEPKDYDIATAADPDTVLHLFPGSHAVGKAFGVVVVSRGDLAFEVATFRSDHGILDGRHPEHVSFVDAATDARRRDFTVNALFYDPLKEQVIDYVEGRRDLADRRIRFVGQPQLRIREDRLRMLRAARFASTMNFELESDSAHAIQQEAATITTISAERIRDELTRILLESRLAGQAVVLLDRLELLLPILPEVTAMKGQEQPPQFHPEGDVFTHTVIMLDNMTDRSEALVFALLLHDIGKPPTAVQAVDRLRFNGHAAEGARMAAAILKRLRFSNKTTDAVVTAIANHMRFMDVQRMKPSTLRRMLGAETFPMELELHRLDCLASHESFDNYDFLVRARRNLREEPALPDPWVTGTDIMEMGIPEGPAVGKWHRVAYEAQLNGTVPDRPALLEWLSKQIADRSHPQ